MIKPSERSGHSAVLYKEMMIICGGASLYDGDAKILNDIVFLIYKKWSMVWRIISYEPGSSHGAVIVHDDMYIIFGASMADGYPS